MKLNLKNISVVITDSLFDEICNLGIEHFPNEFGGFLFGKYSDDFKVLSISKSLLPIKHKGLPFQFERSTDGVEKIIEELFINENLYYVGEWHAHPNGSSQYSSTDLQSMIEIANCNTVKIENPILLILGVLNGLIREYSIYFYHKMQLLKYDEENNP